MLSATGVMLAGYMARVVAGANPGEHKALVRTLEALLEDLSCSVMDRKFVLDIANRDPRISHMLASSKSHVGPTRSKSTVEEKEEGHIHSSLATLREVVRRLGTKHRDKIYLRRMEVICLEPGFEQFVDTADRIQALALQALGGQVARQSCVPEGIPWASGAIRLLDSACGVRGRYNDFMSILAQKSGADFEPAPMKGLFRLSEKLWLRPMEGNNKLHL